MNTNDGTRFVFDNVFPMDRQLSNIQVYNKSCYNVVNKFLEEGYNGTIFAYGMTGSGKTFSMKGCDTDPGFVELAINDIFQKSPTTPLQKNIKWISRILRYIMKNNRFIIWITIISNDLSE